MGSGLLAAFPDWNNANSKTATAIRLVTNLPPSRATLRMMPNSLYRVADYSTSSWNVLIYGRNHPGISMLSKVTWWPARLSPSIFGKSWVTSVVATARATAGSQGHALAPNIKLGRAHV